MTGRRQRASALALAAIEPEPSDDDVTLLLTEQGLQRIDGFIAEGEQPGHWLGVYPRPLSL